MTKTIRARFTRLSVAYVCLVLAFGGFSLWRVLDYQRVAADIQTRFLPNTRYLGDLNNYTSDFRAAEANGLLAESPEQARADIRAATDLDRLVQIAQQGYAQAPRIPEETANFRRFDRDWTAYKAIAWRVLELAADQRTAEARRLYLTESRAAYDKASDALGALTNQNVTEAGAAVERAKEAFATALLLICAAGACAAIMTIGVSAYMRRSIADPLRALAASMRRLAANQMDIDLKGVERNDEIGEMARAVDVFRDNAAELAVNQRALAAQASLLEEKLAFEQRLASAQRNFVAMASHEFRTPLTIIDGHAQRLLKAAKRSTPADLVERAGKIRHAVLRMTSVMDNLLSSGRLLDGDAELYVHPEIIDLPTLLREVCRLYREVNPDAYILEQFPEEGLEAYADARLLFQALSNLISNGLKYSRATEMVSVSARRDGGFVRIDIDDKGIGIPEADIDKVFDRYFRGRNVGGAAGAGIGLYLVKTVVALHGGRVAVESTLGVGSCFSLWLPARPPETEVAASDRKHEVT